MPNLTSITSPPPLQIVLVQPEIPPNTGNIARTCAVTGCRLHLIEPLGFRLTDRDLKRAGLDYWHELDIQVWPNLEAYLDATGGVHRWWLTTKAPRRIDQVTFAIGDHLCFGSETSGLGPDLLARYPESLLRIPMRPSLRSLNLSSAVAAVVYAALGQMGYPGMG